ncbi:MAG: hypothetical protein Tsb002_22310 [Wenzhouxiangellaceae bacterium]
MNRIALLALIASFSVTAQAELTVDEIIANSIETRGGYEAIKAIDSARFTGTANFGGAQAPVQMEWARPNKVRMEFEVQGMTIIQSYDGEQGWAIMPLLGKTEPEPMAEDQLKEIQQQADLDGEFVDYREKGHQIELLGQEEVDGTAAYHLKITRDSGDVAHVYVDDEYFLPFKQVSKTSRQGLEITLSTTIGDYKEVAGVLMPHSFESTVEGAPAGQTIVIDQVETGIDLPAAHFAMPAVETATEAE